MYLCVDAVDRWCVANKGRALRLDRPGSRGASRTAKSYFCAEYPVYSRTGGDTTSVLAAVLNRMKELGRPDDSHEVMRNVVQGGVDEPRVRGLADLSKWFSNAVGRCSLVHVPGVVDPSPNCRAAK